MSHINRQYQRHAWPSLLPVDESLHNTKNMHSHRPGESPDHRVRERSKGLHQDFSESLDGHDESHLEHDEDIEKIKSMLRGKRDSKAKPAEKENLLKQLLATIESEKADLQPEKYAKLSQKITADLRERFLAVSKSGNYDKWTTGKERFHKRPDPTSRDTFTCDDNEPVALEVVFAQNLMKFGIVPSQLVELWEKELNVGGTQTGKIIVVSRRKAVVQTLCNNLGHVTSFFSSRPSVHSIHFRPHMELLNKHATTVMQGAGSGLQPLFWNKGLTGEGQIVGIADTGIDVGTIVVLNIKLASSYLKSVLIRLDLCRLLLFQRRSLAGH